MSLTDSRPALEQAIRKAFLNSKNSAEGNNPNPEANITDLSKALAAAIHDYVMKASVDITDVVTEVPAGAAVESTGSTGGTGDTGTSGSQVGATTTPSIAQHSGYGKLL
jgi:hypothetical protein